MIETVTLMLVVVLNNFNDKVENVHRKRGDFFKCTKERYEEILSVDNTLVKAVPDAKDVPDPEGYTSDPVQNPVVEEKQSSNKSDNAIQNQNDNESVCDIAQLSDEELLKLAKEKKIKNASKMSREQLIEALQ